ncbi:MAG: KEOPS complex kinase/ATPase Bud32 [Candidatus Bathyarchaeia archaeon]
MGDLNRLPQLLRKGAEADILLDQLDADRVVVKRRIRKAYRHETLDRRIRLQRTQHEAGLLRQAKQAGVSTPLILFVDRGSHEITMQHVEGTRLKDYLDSATRNKRASVCRNLGKAVGQLHKNNIIHGDLTTSNIILTRNGKLVFLDFGLGQHSILIEDRGVDLSLLYRALTSYHHTHALECFKNVLQGYEATVDSKTFESIKAKIVEIKRRGRYIAER